MTIGDGGSGGYAYVLHEPTPEQHRAKARAEYVRAHAPAIFAGLCADKAKWSTWDVQITVAVEIAGLLFDETEPRDG